MPQNYHIKDLLLIYIFIILIFFLFGFYLKQQKEYNIIITQENPCTNSSEKQICILSLVVNAIDQIVKGHKPSDFELSFELVQDVYDLKKERVSNVIHTQLETNH
jgi:hypothetical protein